MSYLRQCRLGCKKGTDIICNANISKIPQNIKIFLHFGVKLAEMIQFVSR